MSRLAFGIGMGLGISVVGLLLGACRGPSWNTLGPRYTDARLSEPSGLVASMRQPGVFWTHNDSGDDAILYAVTADGRLLARFEVMGATAHDWEAVTIDRAGNLYVGDIGNNANARRDLVVYRLSEPAVALDGETLIEGRIEVSGAIPFHFPEQTRFPPPKRNFDAEALFYAPRPGADDGTLYLLSKRRGDMRTVLYRFDRLDGAPQPLVSTGSFELGGDPDNYGGMVTGADLHPDGQLLAVLTYHALFIFERPAQGDDWLSNLRNRIDFDQKITVQAEAVAWDGDTVVFTNEQGSIFRVQNPLTPREGRFP